MRYLAYVLAGLLLSSAVLADDVKGINVYNNTDTTVHACGQPIAPHTTMFFDHKTVVDFARRSGKGCSSSCAFSVPVTEKDIGWHDIIFSYYTLPGDVYLQSTYAPGYICAKVEGKNNVILWQRASIEGGGCVEN
jgi:hypothetical protein